MKIGIVGATGFIGSRLAALARDHGHEIVAFSRRPGPGMRLFASDVPPDLVGLDAVVNLAGESLMGRWTKEKKRRILDSRVQATSRIVEALTEKGGPRVLINASAVGFYGDTGATLVDERSSAGTDFLARVCLAWEAAALRAEEKGLRVVLIRSGMVLGHGGAMALLKPVFLAGLGGRLGGGRQWMSAMHVDDVAGLILWALENASVRGPVNAVMPDPFRNEEFTRALARQLERPAILPVPAFALKLALGEMSRVMLANARVLPRAAIEGRFRFRFPSLAAALREVAR